MNLLKAFKDFKGTSTPKSTTARSRKYVKTSSLISTPFISIAVPVSVREQPEKIKVETKQQIVSIADKNLLKFIFHFRKKYLLILYINIHNTV